MSKGKRPRAGDMLARMRAATAGPPAERPDVPPPAEVPPTPDQLPPDQAPEPLPEPIRRPKRSSRRTPQEHVAMPNVLAALAQEPASGERLVVYVTPEQAAWVRQLQEAAKNDGRRLSVSAIVRAALDQLRTERPDVDEAPPGRPRPAPSRRGST